MKKTYNTPVASIIAYSTEENILQSGSQVGGVKAGARLGDEYSSTDESYSNRRNSIWGEE